MVEGEGDGSASLQDFVEQARQAAGDMADGSGGGGGRDDRRICCPISKPGDILIDGGNSYYIDDIRRAKELAPKGIHYVDVGTSGGVWGLERGYCMMIGGEADMVQHLDPIFATLAPGQGDIPRTPGRARASAAPPSRAICTAARTAPATSSRWCTTESSTESWRHMPRDWVSCAPPTSASSTRDRCRDDAVARSGALPVRPQSGGRRRSLAARQRDCLVAAGLDRASLVKDPKLSKFAGRVSDSGEGRWTIKAAIDEAVPAPVLSAALYERFSSRGEADFQDKLLSAMRFEFGGHVEKTGKP